MAATPYAASFNGSGYYEAVACWLKALPPTTNLDNTKHPLPTYIRRLVEGLEASDPAVVLMACVLLSRTDMCYTHGPHRAFLAAFLVSCKYLIDDFTQYSVLAMAGGVSLKEMRSIEIQLLQKLDFDIWADPIELSLIEQQLLVVGISDSNTKKSGNKHLKCHPQTSFNLHGQNFNSTMLAVLN